MALGSTWGQSTSLNYHFNHSLRAQPAGVKGPSLGHHVQNKQELTVKAEIWRKTWRRVSSKVFVFLPATQPDQENITSVFCALFLPLPINKSSVGLPTHRDATKIKFPVICKTVEKSTGRQ